MEKKPALKGTTETQGNPKLPTQERGGEEKTTWPLYAKLRLVKRRGNAVGVSAWDEGTCEREEYGINTEDYASGGKKKK